MSGDVVELLINFEVGHRNVQYEKYAIIKENTYICIFFFC